MTIQKRNEFRLKMTLGVAGLALMTGCTAPTASPEAIGRDGPALAARPMERGVPARAEGLPVGGQDRTIEPGDTLAIEVLHEKELSGERRVQPSGIILFPPLGTLEVAGQTPSAVAAVLAKRLGEGWFIQPQVSIEIKEFRVQTVSVLGCVEKSGAVKIPSERKMDMLEAIAEAGGFSRIANKKKIDLIRNGQTTSFTLDRLRGETDQTKIWLEPGDIIYVHESFL